MTTHKPQHTMKILLPGGAGLVGQNLIVHLQARGYNNIVVLDKHHANLEILRRVHPGVTAEWADLAEEGDWQRHLVDADVVVMLQAQIGGSDREAFVRNNIQSTAHLLTLMQQHQVPHLVHVSSSVVKSAAHDFYTQTKTEQEQQVIASGVPAIILRPTLMFGWFDRKHLGWLSRFMKKIPVFPIPGHGRYMRQPLAAADFCQIIVRCIENRMTGGIYNISGHERIDYIEIIREVKRATQAKARIIRIPYVCFYSLLWLWGKWDKNPPFTIQQLRALKTRDEFEVIDWPTLFGVPYTPFREAIDKTFNDPRYQHIVLEF